MSGLAAFSSIAPANAFSVGGQTSTVNGTGELRLASNSLITAQTFGVQNVTGSTTAQSAGVLYLGRSTTIHADSGAVGLVRDNGTIQFSPGTVNPTLTIRGSDGASRSAHWRIGSRSSSYFNSNTALVDLVSGLVGASTLDAQVGTLKIAEEGYCLTTSRVLNGMFLMGGGVLDATNIILGLKSSVATQSLATVNATFMQTNGGRVMVNTLTLGDRVPGNTGVINATYELADGTLRAQSIQAGSGGANRTFLWGSGTIQNYDAATDLLIGPGLSLDLASNGVHELRIDPGRVGVVEAALVGLGGLVKAGGGLATLAGSNQYLATTVVNEGTLQVGGALHGAGTVTVKPGATLGGTGFIQGPVLVEPSGTLSPGVEIGTLTISNALILGGNLVIEVDKALSPANDLVVVGGTLTNVGAGMITVTNVGTNALAVGDRFQLFSKPMLGGGALTIASGDGMIWNNRLSVDGSIEVASLINLEPTNLVVTANGNKVELWWSPDHTGWRLEVQTNNLSMGLGTNWFTWSGSAETNRVSIPINTANPSVFYRLVYP
jgi:autotransporter-associated beta strand protein